MKNPICNEVFLFKGLTEHIERLMRPLPDYIHRDIFDIPFIEADDIDISGLNNSQSEHLITL